MAYQKRPGDGTLFTNDKKGDNEKAPDRKGDALIHCPHCNADFEAELAGWLKDGKNGKFLSMSIKAKGDRKPASRPAQKPRDPDLDPADEPW